MASNSLNPQSDLSKIRGIGPKYVEKFKRIEINSIHDLSHHYPRKYLDYTRTISINQFITKKDVSFEAIIDTPKRFSSRAGKLITQAIASDETGKIKLTWFNNPYIQRLIIPNQKYLITGKITSWNNQQTIISPNIEPIDGLTIHSKGLVPIYPETDKLSSKFIRQKIHTILKECDFEDPVPSEIIASLKLLKYKDSLSQIHFPDNKKIKEAADKRLSFNQHLAINLDNQIELRNLSKATKLCIDESMHNLAVSKLPFKLTTGQKRAIKDSYGDLETDEYTHRLIQGETGSGKTIVIYFLSIQSIKNKKSFVVMAPTEILANQHFQSFISLGVPKKNIALITSKSKFKDTNKPTIYIGTHALLSQLPKDNTVEISGVAIDEQHKFGVQQREALIQRTPLPHVFNLTATPIPRTIALGLFGEIKTSTIKTKPKNRLPIITWIISPDRFRNSHDWISQKLKNGSKIYVVAPQINKNSSSTVSSIIDLYSRYQREFGQETKILMVHGQMKKEDIDSNVNQFKKSYSGILLGTSVIEVGIDVPEADVIIIHSAERFGLASLHQLRGRVGRGERQSYCLLLPSSTEQEVAERLLLMKKYHSAITLAKMDLKLRGSGDMFGLRQHGWMKVRLKYFWDKELFSLAKSTAKQLINQNEANAKIIANRLKIC